MKTILVTGGAGFIGSHTCVELIKAGYKAVIYDNLCNAHPEVFNRIEKITGTRPEFVQGDVRDLSLVEETIRRFGCEAVIHFAGLKAVGESVQQPLMYFDNNVMGTLRVLEAMKATGCKIILFSSSATVYGVPKFLPYTEEHPLSAINPYGRTKLMSEGMIEDFLVSSPDYCAGVLRYFNPVGAHESGLIGEDPKGIPNNLFPYVTQVAIGQREFLTVLGDDYETPDGTGVRDYIHVVDLALGHVLALDKLLKDGKSFTINLGTGKGYSVLDVVHAFEKASGRKVAYKIGPRRDGDLPIYYADPTTAEKLIGWRSARDLDQMCADGWNWQSKNPNGYN